MMMDVVMVTVVVRPSLVIAVVSTIGITDNEVVVKIGIILVMGPGSSVKVRELDPGGFVIGEDGFCEFDGMPEFGTGGGIVWVTVMPANGAVVTPIPGLDGFIARSFSRYMMDIPMMGSNPPLPPAMGSCRLML